MRILFRMHAQSNAGLAWGFFFSRKSYNSLLIVFYLAMKVLHDWTWWAVDHMYQFLLYTMQYVICAKRMKQHWLSELCFVCRKSLVFSWSFKFDTFNTFIARYETLYWSRTWCFVILNWLTFILLYLLFNVAPARRMSSQCLVNIVYKLIKFDNVWVMILLLYPEIVRFSCFNSKQKISLWCLTFLMILDSGQDVSR